MSVLCRCVLVLLAVVLAACSSGVAVGSKDASDTVDGPAPREVEGSDGPADCGLGIADCGLGDDRLAAPDGSDGHPLADGSDESGGADEADGRPLSDGADGADGPCVPDCQGKQCGDNGCGTSCGLCGEGYECEDFQCVCQPACEDKECGDDACGGQCGQCAPDEYCNNKNQCACKPVCAGKECGPDGCGGQCGNCLPGQWCIDYACTQACQDDCFDPGGKSCLASGWRECGEFDDDPCLDWGPLTPCDPGLSCVGGDCVCVGVCTGMECGDDGCGGSCGKCVGEPCVDGLCGCEADCTGRICGDDGCFGTCGACEGFQVCDVAGQCVPAPGEGEYRVGVDYHAVGSGFDNMAFLGQYEIPMVRNMALTQLQGMADAGADIVSTRIWLVANKEQPTLAKWQFNFPPTEQQLKNLRQYATDVAGIKKSGGAGLELHLTVLYLGCADYTLGSPLTTLGSCFLSKEVFGQRLNQSIAGILEAIKGIFRDDGAPIVTLFYLDGEVMTALDDNDPAAVFEKKNQRWFLSQFYADLADDVRHAGHLPSLYFIAAAQAGEALDSGFVDPYVPALSGHRSAYWIYRTVKFLKDAGLPVPERIDFSLYPKPPTDMFGAATVVNRVFDDVEATVGPLVAPGLRYGVAETYYPADEAKRTELGRGLASEHDLRGANPETVCFWTTPYNDNSEQPAGYPFDFPAYRSIDVALPFSGLNPSFETDADGSGRPDGWETAWANGTPDTWSVTQHKPGGDPEADSAPDGAAVLRIETGACQQCTGDFDGAWVLSDPVAATPGKVALVRVWHRTPFSAQGTLPWTADFSGAVAAILAYDEAGEESLVAVHALPADASLFRRAVLAGRIPDSAVSLRLRFGLQKAWDGVLDVDLLH